MGLAFRANHGSARSLGALLAGVFDHTSLVFNDTSTVLHHFFLGSFVVFRLIFRSHAFPTIRHSTSRGLEDSRGVISLFPRGDGRVQVEAKVCIRLAAVDSGNEGSSLLPEEEVVGTQRATRGVARLLATGFKVGGLGSSLLASWTDLLLSRWLGLVVRVMLGWRQAMEEDIASSTSHAILRSFLGVLGLVEGVFFGLHRRGLQ
jgi:hypothetical protein